LRFFATNVTISILKYSVTCRRKWGGIKHGDAGDNHCLMYSGSASFGSRPEDQLCWLNVSWFPIVEPGECRDNTFKQPWPLLYKCFTHLSLIIPPFDDA
jgi:hypothetical protein